jgi:UDP-N-acetylglucosamine 2-epimerase (non-hydrolysing)/GDP/UDP-N,N'-diacetylbacillosamine 2-epimerase (hydrolysing)
MVYPNCDAGSKKFVKLIEKYEDKEYLHLIKNIPHSDYLNIMKHVDVMIGNSSSGIIESPSFKIPVLNIGSRQQGRERSDNVIDVPPNRKKIIKSIHYAMTDSNFKNQVKSCSNLFGDGAAAQKIVNVFKTIKINETFIQKQITY